MTDTVMAEKNMINYPVCFATYSSDQFGKPTSLEVEILAPYVRRQHKATATVKEVSDMRHRDDAYNWVKNEFLKFICSIDKSEFPENGVPLAPRRVLQLWTDRYPCADTIWLPRDRYLEKRLVRVGYALLALAAVVAVVYFSSLVLAPRAWTITIHAAIGLTTVSACLVASVTFLLARTNHFRVSLRATERWYAELDAQVKHERELITNSYAGVE